jgi:hypothetical protein
LHFKSFSLAELAISRGFSKSKVRFSGLFSPHSAFPSEGAMRKSIFSIFTIPKLKTSLQKKKKLIHSLNSPSKIKNKKKFLAFLIKLFIFTELYISSLLV